METPYTLLSAFPYLKMFIRRHKWKTETTHKAKENVIRKWFPRPLTPSSGQGCWAECKDYPVWSRFSPSPPPDTTLTRRFSNYFVLSFVVTGFIKPETWVSLLHLMAWIQRSNLWVWVPPAGTSSSRYLGLGAGGGQSVLTEVDRKGFRERPKYVYTSCSCCYD